MEFIGVVMPRRDEGEVSYDLHAAITRTDLPPSYAPRFVLASKPNSSSEPRLAQADSRRYPSHRRPIQCR